MTSSSVPLHQKNLKKNLDTSLTYLQASSFYELFCRGGPQRWSSDPSFLLRHKLEVDCRTRLRCSSSTATIQIVARTTVGTVSAKDGQTTENSSGSYETVYWCTGVLYTRHGNTLIGQHHRFRRAKRRGLRPGSRVGFHLFLSHKPIRPSGIATKGYLNTLRLAWGTRGTRHNSSEHKGVCIKY